MAAAPPSPNPRPPNHPPLTSSIHLRMTSTCCCCSQAFSCRCHCCASCCSSCCCCCHHSSVPHGLPAPAAAGSLLYTSRQQTAASNRAYSQQALFNKHKHYNQCARAMTARVASFLVRHSLTQDLPCSTKQSINCGTTPQTCSLQHTEVRATTRAHTFRQHCQRRHPQQQQQQQFQWAARASRTPPG